MIARISHDLGIGHAPGIGHDFGMKESFTMRYVMIMLIVALAAPVAAIGQTVGPCAGALSAEQIHNCLSAPVVTRGIKRRGISVEGEQTPDQGNSVDLTVNFEFNSAKLTNDGMISLDALGKAIATPDLRNLRYRIAGHTDAVGSDAYNLKLSQVRAAAVLAYLEQNYQLDGRNFEVVGYGKTQLYDPNDPTAAINRRVQVTKLSN
jgi:outer membrane protein OmpA-like peptidoglycan-associated protein